MRGTALHKLPRWTIVSGRRWLVTLLGSSGYGLRTIPPIRYVPILGKEKEITTTQVLAKALKDRDLAVRERVLQVLNERQTQQQGNSS